MEEREWGGGRMGRSGTGQVSDSGPITVSDAGPIPGTILGRFRRTIPGRLLWADSGPRCRLIPAQSRQPDSGRI